MSERLSNTIVPVPVNPNKDVAGVFQLPCTVNVAVPIANVTFASGVTVKVLHFGFVPENVIVHAVVPVLEAASI